MLFTYTLPLVFQNFIPRRNALSCALCWSYIFVYIESFKSFYIYIFELNQSLHANSMQKFAIYKTRFCQGISPGIIVETRQKAAMHAGVTGLQMSFRGKELITRLIPRCRWLTHPQDQTAHTWNDLRCPLYERTQWWPCWQAPEGHWFGYWELLL